MAIELIPKKPEAKKITFGDILFGLLVVLFLAAVTGYFVLGQMDKNAHKQMQEIEDALAKKESDSVKALEEKIFLARDKIIDFAEIMNDHTWTSNIFVFLEKYTHPRILLTQFNFNRDNNLVGLSGKAESFEALGQQIQLFENGKYVKGVVLSRVGIVREGGIEFGIDISFNRDLLLKRRENALD